jgi:thymidylate synthase (FAD)
MQGISVELLDYCGSDEAVANAARVSFSAFGDWNSIPEGYTKERCAKLIKYLASHKHTTPFRQNCITIRCQAPIFLARQLMKHQSGLTWSEASRRYVDTPPEFFIPEKWRSRPEGSLKQGSGNGVITHLNENKDSNWTIELDYKDLLNCSLELYQRMLDSGVAPEMARIVLPQSMLVDWVWSGNLLAYAHCFNLRIKENAQIEAQVFAEQLDKVLAPLFPVSWQALTKEE